MLNDDVCRLIAWFGKKTGHLFMFAECCTGGVLDLKFAIKIDGSRERMTRFRDVKSRSVLVSAVDSSQVSWVTKRRTYFARGLENLTNANVCRLTFTNLMIKLKGYCPKQNHSLSDSCKLDENDKFYEKHIFSWMKT